MATFRGYEGSRMVWERTVKTDAELEKIARWLKIREANNVVAEVRLVSRRPISKRIKVGDDSRPTTHDPVHSTVQGRLPSNMAVR